MSVSYAMKRTISRIVWILLSLAAIALAVFLFSPRPVEEAKADYWIMSRLAVNQPGYFPLKQSLDPRWYRPIAPWIGRLILPKPEEYSATPGEDWTWLQVYQAPRPDLVGQKVRLGWRQSPALARYLGLVTKDIRFTPEAIESEKQGNILPTRLNGRSGVGPLQALAGSRPLDDVVVSFPDAEIGETSLQVERMPLIVTGRFVALVKIIGEAPPRTPSDIPKVCPGSPPCGSELFRVQHYNRDSGQFDGSSEVIRIPQQPLVSGGRFISTPRQLAAAREGKEGWYIYGARGRDNLFTVQAIKPRSLFQLQPTATLTGVQSGQDYIARSTWNDTPSRKGTASRVTVLPEGEKKSWKEGDKGIGIHLFGGIGGKKGEIIQLGTVTGHFSYFLYEVIRDALTGELQWQLDYDQVYAHNPQGILSGYQSWANYTGSLERGWLNSRPLSDAIVKLDLLEDYNFGGVSLSPLTEFHKQLEIMMARYRIGDGTGVSSVTPATSCVQDSNQALYITIATLRHQFETDPQIAAWLTTHADDPETLRFQRLGQLSDRLERVLAPRGVIRPDWRQNAQILAGITDSRGKGFIRENTLANALLSWRSMLPRGSNDVISEIFLRSGATLWFLRTNQVGGAMPEILPLAPTKLFGEMPMIAPMLRRTLAAIVLPLTGRDWGVMAIGLGLYGAIALTIGFRSGFLRWRSPEGRPLEILKMLVFCFFFPAFWEEFVFRVLLIPHPETATSTANLILSALVSITLFTVYHPLNAIIFYKKGNPTFFQPIFLILAALLGLTCTVVYWLTGSLWTISVLHWLVVVVWLLFLNGLSRLTRRSKRGSF
jgi:predicted Abi (CAAX) family protease